MIITGVSQQTVMATKSYQNQAQMPLKNYLLADLFIPNTSILAGILACKVAYEPTQLLSSVYVKTYAELTCRNTGLTKMQKIEWNKPVISTIHATFITAMSLYLIVWSDLFSDQQLAALVTFQNTLLSTFGLGASVGYFLMDLVMILWLYPSLWGIEYVVHHFSSTIAVAYSMFTGEAKLYTYMIIISEVRIPEIHMRW
ncbi:hypothetical protein SLE2022_306670 [Rubroshorea leprosula]